MFKMFGERASHSVLPYDLFVLWCLFLFFIISHFGFDDRILVLIVLVPGHCLLFTYS